ncbi:hypothetical protein WDZ92_39110, partial [Nostoc sp. NIES-2111]
KPTMNPHQKILNLSRVPVISEAISYYGAIYTVESVLHVAAEGTQSATIMTEQNERLPVEMDAFIRVSYYVSSYKTC